MITGKHLTAMPLHAVTEVLGSAGLARRLELELLRLPPADRRLVAAAAVWATELHGAQRRVREPYINHLLRVTLRILCYYRVEDPEVLAAALLHDSVEDQPVTIQTIISRGYGTRVAALVASVTTPARPSGVDRVSHYLDHLSTTVAASPWGRVIKLSDFTDNGVGIIHTTGPKAARVAVKYAPAVPVLRSLLSLPDTPLTPPVKTHIHAQLDLATTRIAAVLG
ncbi:HD domain-containing protein [Catenuloplanes japonicus]|uniref:HD domain-containing protein n=1 Tax=Catenuloplanes japonicus TaxID=33876 RepID=UPI000525C469|nr:HD domain-containing protein [Catenuloplanes japonicus]